MGLIIAHSFQMPTDSISDCECSGRHDRSENESEKEQEWSSALLTALAVIQN